MYDKIYSCYGPRIYANCFHHNGSVVLPCPITHSYVALPCLIPFNHVTLQTLWLLLINVCKLTKFMKNQVIIIKYLLIVHHELKIN